MTSNTVVPMPTPPPPTFKHGDRFGGYSVVARLGGGFFGETWLCENEITKRKAVLKGLRADLLANEPSFLAGFDILARSREEANILAALNARRFEFVPALHDAIAIPDGRTFFLMEYVEGRLLKDWIPATENSPTDRARLALGLLNAIIKLHAVDIIHRDLAGDNIIVEPEPGSFKILDFGIAKIKSELLVKRYSQVTTDPFSKLKYTPPKALAARVAGRPITTDESWDLYALGVLFFELFSGALTTMPESDITPQNLQRLPCPEAVRALLEHGRTDSATSAGSIAVTMQREFRQADLGAAIEESRPSAELIAGLNQEITHLRQDLASRRGTTGLEDIARYLSRMELDHTVHPKQKRLSFGFGDPAIRHSRFVIDASDVKMLRIFTSHLRYVSDRIPDLLAFLNEVNLAAAIVRVTFDPDDGEVQISLDIPHAHTAVPFEEFSAQLGAMLVGVEALVKQLDKKFGPASSRVPPKPPPKTSSDPS